MKMTGLLLLVLMGLVTARHGPTGEVVTYNYQLSGIVYLGDHQCVFRDGELSMTGQLLQPGQMGNFIIEAGFATTESGTRIHIDGGRLSARSIPSTDTQAIANALGRTGVTPEQFFQRTGRIPPENGVFEVLPGGVAFVDGLEYPITVGVVVILALTEVPEVVQPTVDPAVQQTQTIFVTEAYQTTTVVEPVTLTKSSTRDFLTTVNAPVYNTVEVTATQFIKQTVNVPEQQVIRSPAAGNVVINTVVVPSQTIMVVRDTSTIFSVLTAIGDAVMPVDQVETTFSFRTVTVDVPAVTTITQTITRTSVATVAVTETVRNTLYSTTTVYSTAIVTPRPQGY